MPIIGIEPMTYCLRDSCSTAELYRQYKNIETVSIKIHKNGYLNFINSLIIIALICFVMPIIGIEPMTHCLRDSCSTAELYRQI